MEYLGYKNNLTAVEKNTKKLVDSFGSGERAHYYAAKIIEKAAMGDVGAKEILKEYGLDGDRE